MSATPLATPPVTSRAALPTPRVTLRTPWPALFTTPPVAPVVLGTVVVVGMVLGVTVVVAVVVGFVDVVGFVVVPGVLVVVQPVAVRARAKTSPERARYRLILHPPGVF